MRLYIFCLLVAALCTPAMAMAKEQSWALESDRMELIQSKDNNDAVVLQSPRISADSDEPSPSINADAGSFLLNQPQVVDLSGAVRISMDDLIADTEEARFSLVTGQFKTEGTLTVVLDAPGSRLSNFLQLTFHCQNGHLFIDGEDQGEVGEDNAVQLSPSMSIHCSGNPLVAVMVFKEK